MNIETILLICQAETDSENIELINRMKEEYDTV
jgi:hypothetical protein